jgi:hypothetical protein
MTTLSAILTTTALLSLGAAASGSPRINPFACRGEAEAAMTSLSAAEIGDELDKRLTEPPPADDPGRAHKACVMALLMQRIGDTRTAAYFEKAIALRPDEPGYELWYGYYLRNVRGAGGPLLEQAEVHYERSLEKLRALEEKGESAPFDPVTKEWTERGLLLLYQSDGLPVVYGRSFPYGSPTLEAPSLFVTATGRVARDTNDLNEVSDVRKFNAEKAYSNSLRAPDDQLTPAETKAIIRAPLQTSGYVRARLRQPWIGALDVSYRAHRLADAQITDFHDPLVRNDVSVDELGVSLSRQLDLYPLFDVQLKGGYAWVHRMGVVEYEPTLVEDINLWSFQPVVSRFLGADKLRLALNYLYFDIPDRTIGALADRARSRTIASAELDYGLYWPLLLPQLPSFRLERTDTRGFNLYAGIALDNEIFGLRVVEKKDYYGGLSMKGLGPMDVTVQGTVFKSDVVISGNKDEAQANSQWRTTLVVLARLLDEDATPGLPSASLGVEPAFLHLVFPLRHDVALHGSHDYDNVRAGVEVWAKALSTALRGTHFLTTVGYDYQYFYKQREGLHLGHLDLRMGW